MVTLPAIRPLLQLAYIILSQYGERIVQHLQVNGFEIHGRKQDMFFKEGMNKFKKLPTYYKLRISTQMCPYGSVI